MSKTLGDAIALAAIAHKTSRPDKGGNPYILHPLRVMLSLSTLDERIVGVLHDVVEDCPEWPLERFREEGYSEAVVDALDSVTRRGKSEDYETFVRRAAANPIGRRVKLADLEDNCDLSRIPAPTERDFERTRKYEHSIALIRSLEKAEGQV